MNVDIAAQVNFHLLLELLCVTIVQLVHIRYRLQLHVLSAKLASILQRPDNLSVKIVQQENTMNMLEQVQKRFVGVAMLANFRLHQEQYLRTPVQLAGQANILSKDI